MIQIELLDHPSLEEQYLQYLHVFVHKIWNHCSMQSMTYFTCKMSIMKNEYLLQQEANREYKETNTI